MITGNWILEPSKFLNKNQAGDLLGTAKERAEISQARSEKVAVRDYFVVHFNIGTGLRVMELADLNCGDLFINGESSSVLVRNGKGSKKRLVFISESLANHCKEYLQWKKQTGEPVEDDSPLFLSSNTGKHMTPRALQKVFKRCAERAKLDPKFSIHCLRHTYACLLLKASDWNLRLVQKQLGHARISTTQVYADVMMPDIEKALNKMNI